MDQFRHIKFQPVKWVSVAALHLCVCVYFLWQHISWTQTGCASISVGLKLAVTSLYLDSAGFGSI